MPDLLIFPAGHTEKNGWATEPAPGSRIVKNPHTGSPLAGPAGVMICPLVPQERVQEYVCIRIGNLKMALAGRQ
ncbi:MAG: hypothetical protein CVV32_07410 [Methanomicrobiales archaeon HGW-Methanomicrobiales-3]|nr:MAG: hypothetical protein CVV32_07410 [Methanomicrobiales archaeon HGW-Methanomicrobiales-3]